jgi:hypothetical protein
VTPASVQIFGVKILTTEDENDNIVGNGKLLKVEKLLICPFQRPVGNGLKLVMWSDLSTYPYIYYSLVVCLVSEIFHTCSRNRSLLDCH